MMDIRRERLREALNGLKRYIQSQLIRLCDMDEKLAISSRLPKWVRYLLFVGRRMWHPM